MERYFVRQANIDDVSTIQALNNELFELESAHYDEYLIKDWPLSKDGLEYFTNAIENSYVIVVLDGNDVVGYLLGDEVEYPYYDFKIAELCNMCVSSKYRKLGLGKMLFQRFQADYIAKGIDRFIVTASYKNESAIAFYKKIGFTEGNITLTMF